MSALVIYNIQAIRTNLRKSAENVRFHNAARFSKCFWPLETCNFLNKHFLTQVFSCEILEIFKNSFLYRTTPVAASHRKNVSN